MIFELERAVRRPPTGLIVLLAAWLPAVAPAEDEASSVREAKVTYVTASTIYVDAGTGEGLQKGDVLKVFRDGEFVTALEVSAVATGRAACRRAEDVEIQVGDVARFRALAANEPDPLPATTATAPTRARHTPGGGVGWLPEHGIRGRIGLRYLGRFDGTTFGEDYSQPAVDFRLTASSLGHPDLHFETDVRARRTYRTPPAGATSQEGRTRVYRLATDWSPRQSGFRATAGRHTAALLSVGIFDGVTAEYGRSAWRVGAFSGTQPDATDFGLSGAVREHGAYVRLRDAGEGPVRWRLTTGVVGSYTEGVLNREHVVVEGRYSDPLWSVSAIQDVDLNRGWKRAAGESVVSLTSSLLTARYRVSERTTIHGGVDSRRSVRLVRHQETPETDFDDAYRQGAWSGIEWRPARAARLGADVRRTTGGTAGHADALTLTAASQVPRWRSFTARARSSGYRSEMAEGWLHSISAGLRVTPRLHAELGGGFRDETDDTGATSGDDLRWYSADFDFRLTRSVFTLLSVERTRGEGERSEQLFATALYRF